MYDYYLLNIACVCVFFLLEDRHSFTLDVDTTSFGKYLGGGTVTEVKMPKILNFVSIRISFGMS